MTKEERTRALRYKKPALASMGFDQIYRELSEIQEACYEVQWFIDSDDGTLLNALDDNEEQEWEFKLAFADLSAKADRLSEMLMEFVVREEYNDCTVALIGNRYDLVGYDWAEEDYYSLCGYDTELATSEAGKRLMRHTKAEMISTIGQCLGVLISFLDIRQSYDYLKATMDILRDENTSVLRTIKQIDALYDQMMDPSNTFVMNRKAERDFDRLLESLPQRAWLE